MNKQYRMAYLAITLEEAALTLKKIHISTPATPEQLNNAIILFNEALQQLEKAVSILRGKETNDG